ncbi:MAG: sigma-70 family RNA polymerase sigma factor [Syntrophomonadales bacterium]
MYLANLEFESDEALIKLAQQGEHEAAQALILRYQGRVKFLVRKYFLPGSERDDVLQEGYAALYQAILTFDGEKASFPTFASTVVRRQLITRIRAEQNRKRRVTGNTISLETRRFVNDEELPTIEDTLADRKERLPEDVLIELETIEDINRTAREKLTDYEWAVFVGRMWDGKSYQEIAEEIGTDAKGVDNAMVRVRRKLARFAQRLRDVR